jgi:hypothetical protein
MSSDSCVYSTVAFEWKAIQCYGVVNSKFLDSLVPMLHTLTAMLRSAKQPSFLFQIPTETATLSCYKLCCYNTDNFMPFCCQIHGSLVLPSRVHLHCCMADAFVWTTCISWSYICVFPEWQSFMVLFRLRQISHYMLIPFLLQISLRN